MTLNFLNKNFGLALFFNTILIPFLVLISEVFARHLMMPFVPKESLLTLSFIYLFTLFFLLYRQSFRYFSTYFHFDRRALQWLSFSHLALFGLLYLRLISDLMLSNIIWAVALLGISAMHYVLALRTLKDD